MIVTVRTTFPPSANTAYRNAVFGDNTRGRVGTKALRIWRAHNRIAVEDQHPQPIEGKYFIRITLGRTDRCRRDCENYAKVPHDMMVEMRIVEDDSLCQRLSIGWQDGMDGCEVAVWPAALGEMHWHFMQLEAA